jgi:hypothetical protein
MPPARNINFYSITPGKKLLKKQVRGPRLEEEIETECKRRRLMVRRHADGELRKGSWSLGFFLPLP